MDPYDLAVRRSLGLPTDTPEDEEGTDWFQPVKTLFGATQGAVPAALSGLMPDAYEAARKENLANFGMDETAPLYEQVEAAPGAGDVAAQFIPEGVRESGFGRAVGPVARMAGNILGDPTTYTPWLLAKAAKGIAGGSKVGAAALKASTAATVGEAAKARAAVDLGLLSAAEAADIAVRAERAGIANVTRALAAESPMRARAFAAAHAIKDAEPLAFGSAAAVTYGPDIVRGAIAGGEETLAQLEEGNVEEALVSGANTALMAGLGGLMGKGLIDAVRAKQVLNKALADQGLMPDVDKMLRERAELTGAEPDLASVTMPQRARPAAERAPYGETPLPPMEEVDLPIRAAVDIPMRMERGRIGPVDLGALQESSAVPGPSARPGIPTVSREMPTGFRGRVYSDEELAARLAEAGEEARARAREAQRVEGLEGAGGGPLRAADRRAQAYLEPEPGSVLDVQPRPGQRVLPGMREPVPPAAAPPARAPRRRSKAQQLRLVGEDETITKPPTARERAEAERQRVEARVTEALNDPLVPDLVEAETKRVLQGDLKELAGGRGSKKGLTDMSRAALLADPEHPKYGKLYRQMRDDARTIATARVTNRFRKMVKEGLDPVEQMRKEREARLALEETAADRPVEPSERIPEDTAPAPWDETPAEPPRQETARVLVDPEEMAAAKLTPAERAYIDDQIREGMYNEREALDSVLRARERRARNPPVEPDFGSLRAAFEEDTAPTTPPTSPRIEPVATEAAPTARAPEAPAAEAPVAAEAAPISETPAVEPTRKPPSTPEERLGRSPEEWADSVIRNERNAEIKARLQESREELVQRVREIQEKDRIDKGQVGVKWTEEAARKAAYAARTELVSTKGWNRKKASMPGIDVDTTKVESPTVKAEAPKAETPKVEEEEPGPSVFETALEGEGRGAGPVGRGAKKAAAGLDREGDEVGRKKAGKAWRLRDDLAEQGAGLSPGTKKYLAVKAQAGKSIEELLDEVGDRRLKDGAFVRAWKERFAAFDQAFDQNLKAKQNPRQARGNAIKAIAQLFEQSEQRVRNVIGQIEGILGERSPVEPAPVQRLGAAPKKAATLADAPKMVEEKRALERPIQEAIARDERPSKEAIGAFLAGYRDLAARIAGLGLRGKHPMLKAENLGVRNLQNLMELLHPGEFAKLKRPSFNDLIDRMAKLEGIEIPKLEAPAPRPKAAVLRPPAALTPIQAREGGVRVFRAPGGTKVELVRVNDQYRIDFEPNERVKNLEAFGKDVDAILADDNVSELKGLDTVLSRKQLDEFVRERGLAEVAQEDGSVIYRVVRKSAGMEADPLNVLGQNWRTYVGKGPIGIGPEGANNIEGVALADHMAEPADAVKTVKPIAESLGVDLKVDAPVTPIGREGVFHQVYLINGKGKRGEEYVLRVGKGPYLPMPTPDQQALVVKPVRTGQFKTVTGEEFTYAVMPRAFGPGFDIDIQAYNHNLLDTFFMQRGGGAQIDVPSYQQQVRQRVVGRLPDGVSIGDFLADAGKVYQRIYDAGLLEKDLVVHQELRAGQLGYVEMRPGEAPNRGVVRVGEGGKRYRLVVLDLGAVKPADRKGLWGEIHEANIIALKESKLERAPEDQLSLAESRELDRRFTADEADGVDIGDGMRVVDHHGQMGWAYGARVAGKTRGAAKAIKGIFDELVKVLSPKTRVEFGGLTTSPYLTGLYRESPAARRSTVYANVMDLVATSTDYDDFVRRVGHVLGHEVAHLAAEGHSNPRFTDLVGYVDNLVKVQEWHEGAVRKLKEAGFTEDLYRQLRESDLTTQYREVQGALYGRPWREAQAFEGVPPRAATGSAAAKSNLAGGGAQAPPGRGADGLQRGGAVRGGVGGEAGDVRPGAAAREGAAERPAEGGPARPDGGEGDDFAEPITAGLESGGTSRGPDLEETVKLLNQLVTSRQLPITQAERKAMDNAVRLAAELSDDEIAKYVNVAPDPRGRPGVEQGPINTLIKGMDLPDRSKARMVIYAKLMDDAGLTALSKPQPWSLVDREVRELLGVHTMEEYAELLRRKDYRSLARDMRLAKAIDYEFQSHLDYLDRQWAKAREAGDDAAADKLFAERRKVQGNAAVMTKAAKDMATGLGRGLGILRAEQLKADPRELMRTMIHSNIAERLRTRLGNDVDVQAQATKLTDQFFEILEKRGDWNELRSAMNLAMRRTTWEKALEFYKAGLLGWPSEIANFVSNSLFRGMRFIEDSAAAALDMTHSKLTGAERSVYLGEMKVSALAARRAWLEAMPKFIDAEKELLKLEGGDLAKMLEQGTLAEDFMTGLGAIEGKVGNFIRFHFDSMQNADTLYKHLSRTDTLYREVYRGLRKKEQWLLDMTRTGESELASVERIVTQLRENVENARKGREYDPDLATKSSKMFSKADEVAERDTFQAELGAAGRGVQTLLREHSWMQVLVPFFRTPTNILKETLTRTPFGALKIGAAALGGTETGAALGFRKAHAEWSKLSKAEKVQEIAKPFVGSAILGTVYTLASTGDITGGGPTSYEEQEALKATGWQPYSIRIGDQWISYQRMEPLSSLLGMAVDMSEAVRNGDVENFNTAAQKAADSIAENLTNKTFLSGISALTGALSNPRQELGNFVKQMQQSVIPNSLGFVPFGHFARALDPVYRQAEPMTMDAFLAKIPFASQSLEPSYGPVGEERRRPGGTLERLVSPFARQTVKEGPLSRGSEELVRVQAVPKAAMRYWTSPQGYKVRLAPEERQLLAKAIQEATTIVGSQMVNDPTYKRLPRDENDPNYVFGGMTQQKMVDRLITKYRARAMKQIMPQLKERARAAYREREV